MNRRILKLAIPSIFANITVPLVGMVDIAISGRLGDVAAIGAIAVGSMLFDLLYWNFGFLRVGTGGLTAQAIGRRSLRDAMKYFTQGISTALVSALFLIAIQWLFVEAAFAFIDCTPDVEQLSRKYFFIRIWGAPATLSLFVFKGWFIGMQNTVSPMAVDIFVNVINLVVSFVLGLHTPMGFVGIAWGTVIAQYSGLILAVVLMLIYYRKLFKYVNIRDDIRFKYMKAFYVLNVNLFFRSLCFMLIYCGFTSIAAKYGDTELAVSSIIMKLLLVFSYFTDGFAYAGEALTGRFIGAKNPQMLRQTIKWTFIWSMGIALIFMLIYQFAGVSMVRVMTSDVAVIEASKDYLPWLLLMPIVGCAAFTWDGIYIGATASKDMRNSTLWALAAFVAVWGIGMLVLNICLSQGIDIQHQPDLEASRTRYGVIAMHVLMAAYFAHLLARTIYLTMAFKKKRFFPVFFT